ncbi:MAG: IS3 family transposase [Lewinella sp.]
MKDHTHEFPVLKMSSVLGVSRSGYYKWLERGAPTKHVEDELDKSIKDSFEESRHTYGSPRIAQDLENKGIKTSESTVARRMNMLEISPKRPKRWVRTTQSDHDDPVAENLLNRNFEADRPATKWVSDITYFEVDQRWYYLTIVLDLADRAIVGWVISDDMTAENTTVAALQKAVANRKPEEELIFHSDRGVQYTCGRMQEEISAIGAVQSMSRKGNCWDNAVAESFFKTIKTECIDRHDFKNKHHAWCIIFEYKEAWYNTKRLHTALKGLTVSQAYEAKMKSNQVA